MVKAKSVVLIDHVNEGVPGPEHFQIVESDVVSSEVKGSITVQLLCISADPYLRMRIKGGSDFGSQAPGSVMVGFVSGKVIDSKDNSDWKVGDLFGANLPFTSVQTLSPEQLKMTLMWKLTGLIEESEISLGVGILGMPGSTAYGGLIDLLRPKEGDVLFVSAASGAVGSMVGMLAKNVYNCQVIGSCGGPAKCTRVKSEFGFDHAIDYKTLKGREDLTAALKSAAPDGIDMYFENVGGFHFEAAFDSLKSGGRIAVCGGISGYNASEMDNVAINPMKMVYSAQRIEGFVCAPWLTGQKGSFLQDMHQFLRGGKIRVVETVTEGIENWPSAFQSLFTGANNGKVVVRV